MAIMTIRIARFVPATNCSATAGPATTIDSGCERTNSSALVRISARIIFNRAKLDTEVLALKEAKLPHLRQKSLVRHDRRRTG